jgi:hypothetical protein
MKLIYSAILILSLIACSNNKSKAPTRPFDNFIFSYSAEMAYSIKFTTNDTVFLFVSFPKTGKKYFSTIQSKDKERLDSFLNTNRLSSFDTTYIQENLSDGVSYKFYLTKDTAVNWVFVYGKEGPKQLYTFASWLTTLKEQLKFYEYNGKVDFGNLKYIELPLVPPPPIDDKNSP